MRLQYVLLILALVGVPVYSQEVAQAESNATTNQEADKPRILSGEEILAQLPPITPLRSGVPSLDAFYMLFPALGSLLRWGSLFPAQTILGAVPDTLQPTASASKVVLVLADDAQAKSRVARQDSATPPNPLNAPAMLTSLLGQMQAPQLGQALNTGWMSPENFNPSTLMDNMNLGQFAPQVGQALSQFQLPPLDSFLGAPPAAAPPAAPTPPAPTPTAKSATPDAPAPPATPAGAGAFGAFFNPSTFDANALLGQMQQSFGTLPPPPSTPDLVAQFRQFFPAAAPPAAPGAGSEGQASDISEVRVKPEAQPAQLRIKPAQENPQQVPLLWFRMPANTQEEEEKPSEDLRIEAKLQAFERQVIAELKLLQQIERMAKEMRASAQGGTATPYKLNYPLSRTPVHKITRTDIERALRDDYVRRLVHKEAQRKSKSKYSTGAAVKRQTMPTEQTMSKDEIIKMMAYAYRMANEQQAAERNANEDKIYAAYRAQNPQMAEEHNQQQARMRQQERQMSAETNPAQNPMIQQRQMAEDQARAQQQQMMMMQQRQMQAETNPAQNPMIQQRQMAEDQARAQQQQMMAPEEQIQQQQRQMAEQQARAQQEAMTAEIQQRQMTEEQVRTQQQQQIQQQMMMMMQQRQMMEQNPIIGQQSPMIQEQPRQMNAMIQEEQQQMQQIEQNPQMMQQRQLAEQQWTDEKIKAMQQRAWAEEQAQDETEPQARHKVDLLGLGGDKRKKHNSHQNSPTVINYYAAPIRSSYGTSYGGGGYGSNAYGGGRGYGSQSYGGGGGGYAAPAYGGGGYGGGGYGGGGYGQRPGYRAAVGNDQIDDMLSQHQTLRTINPTQPDDEVTPVPNTKTTTPSPAPDTHGLQKSLSSPPTSSPSNIDDPTLGSLFSYSEGLLEPYMGLLPISRPDDPWTQKAYHPHYPLYTGGGSYAPYLKENDNRQRRDTHIMSHSADATPTGAQLLTPGMLERLLRIKNEFQRRFPHLYKGMLKHQTTQTRVEVKPPLLGEITKPKIQEELPVYELGAAERLFDEQGEPEKEDEKEAEPELQEEKESADLSLDKEKTNTNQDDEDPDVDYFHFDDEDDE